MDRICIYCNTLKKDSDFSFEHIWPSALGGDFLDPIWSTEDVCKKCNNIAGIFVDAAFLKSWAGMAERATGAHEYVSRSIEEVGVLPLSYLGRISEGPIPSGEVAEFWSGPCGANIVYIWPALEDKAWDFYAGGNPKANKQKHARSYISLTSQEPYWIMCSLKSFYAHFKHCRKFVVNMDVPEQWQQYFTNPDFSGAESRDYPLIDYVKNSAKKNSLKMSVGVDLYCDVRFLSKIALGFGYKTLGPRFLKTACGTKLRMALREGKREKLQQIDLCGVGYHNQPQDMKIFEMLRWPGAWVLLAQYFGGALHLFVVTPTGKLMSIQVCQNEALIDRLAGAFDQGTVWLTVPSARAGVGPISLPDYIQYLSVGSGNADLERLAAKRRSNGDLPEC